MRTASPTHFRVIPWIEAVIVQVIVAAARACGDDGSMPGHLILVPTPIGNLGDLTARAGEALASAHLVACEDTRRTGKLLDHLDLEKPLQRFDDHAGEAAFERVAMELAAGRTVAYCSDAGMPGINDPGFELARLAREAGAEVTWLPGPSAVLLAVVASGLPCHAFSFLGYLPSKGEARRTYLKRVLAREETTVLFETPHRIHEALSELEMLAPDREIALGRELTKLYETWYRGAPSEVIQALGGEDRGEMVLVVAGADAKRTVSDAGAEFTGELPEWARRYLDAARDGGLTLREAVKPIAKHLGVRASEIYRLAAERCGRPLVYTAGMNEREILDALCASCRRLHGRNLLAAGDGNLSYRFSDHRIAMTPSGVSKTGLRPQDLLWLRLDGTVHGGRPSSERQMHLEIYRAVPEAKAVVHAHPPTAIAWSVARPELQHLPDESLPEVILAAGRIPIVPYTRPGTAEMGTALLPFLPQHRLLLLARHGAVCWGESVEEATNGIERLEHVCQILKSALELGGLSALPAAEIAELRRLRERIGPKVL